jgi:23S rRNA (cytidine1920-2'-O)/16S rRNA (cytidine1409-2'-O)-methyltransferase
MRLDLAVVARGLARSRTQAQTLIAANSIVVNGSVATKASSFVADDATIELAGEADHYVSRAAHKLIGALDACAKFGLDVRGRVALDAGASTGGFTQVLIERGVEHVTAVDVGHGQLADQIRGDSHVTAVEGVNVRDLETGSVRRDTDLVVADLSFISLTMVVPALVAAVATPADFVLMVKPQFEVGKARLGRHGVVSSHEDRADAVAGVVAAMRRAGLAIHHVSRSDLPGPHGNVEFFVWGSSAWDASDVGDAGHADHTDAAQRPVLDDEASAAAIAREVAKG